MRSRNTTETDTTTDTEGVTTSTEYRGTGIIWTAVAILVAIVLAVIVSFQNTQDVDIEFLWMDGSIPLVLLLLITVGATVVVTEAIGLVWRHRRRKRLSDRRELRELRSR